MTDIVERLREFRRIGNYSPENKLDPLLDEAANEIERLKAALQQARKDAKLLQEGLIAVIADETNGELAKARAARAALAGRKE